MDAIRAVLTQDSVRTTVADVREMAQHLRAALQRIAGDARRPPHKVPPEQSLFG